jgi:dTDP-4-amino-4,6-dideoxygalactose transaminase
MKIKFVDLVAQYKEIESEIDSAIKSVIGKSAYVGGPFVSEFEKRFANYLGVKYCVGVGNGTDAIFISLKSLGVGEGDEVIVPANSFIATSEAVSLTGAQVVFVDCEPSSFNLDFADLEKKITGKTKAVIPVHLYGQPVDMQKLMVLAEKHNLYVVEDAAQAHGATSSGQKVGAIGDMGCFSFYPGKNLGAYGDAGAIVTNDEKLASQARMFSNHGRREKYDHEYEGINSRLDGLQASILNVKLGWLDRWTDRRRAIAGIYSDSLKNVVMTPSVTPELKHVFHLYVIRVKDRDRFRERLGKAGIDTGIHYPVPLPFLTAYKSLGHKPEDFPCAWSLKDEIVSLPMHGNMTDEQVQYVVNQVRMSLEKV